MNVVDATFAYGDAGRFADVTGGGPVLQPVAPAAFPQRPGALEALLGGANGELPQDESAFQVRVQAPPGIERAPVVVFVPGGGFLSGTGNARWFTAPDFVSEHGVVLVTVNYRLGVLGMLGAAEPLARDAQRPVRDVLQALRWVKSHIASFGGDPDQVTLAGDSAGAWISYALAVMPEGRGLFRRLALVSLPWDPPLTNAGYAERASFVHTELTDAGGLLAASVDHVLDAQASLARHWVGRGMALLPAAGDPIPADVHDFAASAAWLDVDALLLLSTSEEAAAFLRSAPDAAFTDESVSGFLAARFADPAAVAGWIDTKRPGATPKQRQIEAMTLHQFRLAHLDLAQAATGAGVPVQLGGFAVQSPLPGVFSPHCLPLPFLFGNREQWHDAPMLDGIDADLFSRVSRELGEWFAAFIAGAAAGADYDPARPERVEFDGGPVRRERPAELGLVACR